MFLSRHPPARRGEDKDDFITAEQTPPLEEQYRSRNGMTSFLLVVVVVLVLGPLLLNMSIGASYLHFSAHISTDPSRFPPGGEGRGIGGDDI